MENSYTVHGKILMNFKSHEHGKIASLRVDDVTTKKHENVR